MRYDFNADEIFEMAEQIERNGQEFYRKAADAVQEADPRNLLVELADMEADHEKTFQTLRADLGRTERADTAFDPEGEAVLYLKALADTRVFFEKSLDFSSTQAILKSAIEAEKDSIVFYLGMKNAVSPKLGQNRIESIIQEEMSHIRRLSRELVRRSG